jgi:hypothetical protein
MATFRERRIASWGELTGVAILGPLVVPGVLVVMRLVSGLVASEPAPEGGIPLLLLVGPAIPVYIAVLPLLPLGIVKLRRGWRPRVLSLLAVCVGLALLIDGVFSLAAD